MLISFEHLSQLSSSNVTGLIFFTFEPTLCWDIQSLKCCENTIQLYLIYPSFQSSEVYTLMALSNCACQTSSRSFHSEHLSEGSNCTLCYTTSAVSTWLPRPTFVTFFYLMLPALNMNGKILFEVEQHIICSIIHVEPLGLQ